MRDGSFPQQRTENKTFKVCVLSQAISHAPAPPKPKQRSAMQRPAQQLRHLGQRRGLLHQPLGVGQRRQSERRDAAPRVERQEAVEDRLVVLAEQELVVIGADAEIERGVVPVGIMVDDVAQQNQAGAEL